MICEESSNFGAQVGMSLVPPLIIVIPPITPAPQSLFER